MLAVLHWTAVPTVWLPVSVSHQSTCTLAVGIRRTGPKGWYSHRDRPQPPRLSHRPTSIPSPTTNPSCPGQHPNAKLLLENWESTPEQEGFSQNRCHLEKITL